MKRNFKNILMRCLGLTVKLKDEKGIFNIKIKWDVGI